MLFDRESLFEMPHKMTSNIMNFWPLLEYEHNSQNDECCRQYAHPAHETMRLSTAETNM